MRTHPSNGRVRRFIPGVLLILLFISPALILFFFIAASPASASILDVLASPVPTQENLWAHAEIAKPAYTLLPTVNSTNTPVATTVPVATETPASLTMDIVEDT